MDDLIAKLAHPSDDLFYSGLAEVDAEHRHTEFLGRFCAALMESALPGLRQADRLTAVLNKVRFDSASLRALFNNPQALSAPLRNTIARLMAPADRRSFLSPLGPAIEVVPADLPPPAGVPPAFVPPRGTSNPLPNSGSRCSTVAILSAASLQDANKKLLSSNGFAPSVYDTLGDLAADFAESADICGCIVDRSFLQPLTIEQQVEVFQRLAAYSTFIFIRVDEAGLKLSHQQVQNVLRSVRLHNRPVATRELSFQASGGLRESELDTFQRAAAVLMSFQSAAFIPGELREDQRRLLIAAAYEHANELQLHGEIRIESLETRFLQGGFSSAKVALVRVNSDARAVVAKIGDKATIRDELERFRTFVQAVDDQLKPFACFHGGSGAILFAFMPEEGADDRPAKMLDERLQEFWFEELSGRDLTVSYANLCRGLSNAAFALSRLNRVRPVATALPLLGNPDVITPYVERLENGGVNLGLPSDLGPSRLRATARFATLSNAAVSHGDVHLRNILLRGDRSAHLIDFAGSGPGHPAVDLARLEIALFTEFFRPVRPEADYVELQRRLSVDHASFDQLSAEFDLNRGPMINSLCVHGCVAARDHALSVLREHGGDHLDYLSVKYLIAWQALLMHGRQTVLSRSVIRAIAGTFGS